MVWRKVKASEFPSIINCVICCLGIYINHHKELWNNVSLIIKLSEICSDQLYWSWNHVTYLSLLDLRAVIKRSQKWIFLYLVCSFCISKQNSLWKFYTVTNSYCGNNSHICFRRLPCVVTLHNLTLIWAHKSKLSF